MTGDPTLTLHGKSVLITGGARGIGLATARLALSLGARVAVADIDGERARAAAAALAGPDAGGSPVGLSVDVADEAACEAAVAEVVARLGAIDVLVNSAGIIEPSVRTVDQDLAVWRRVIDVNLQGTYLMSRAAARAMTAAGRGGAIVNLSSITGLSGFRASNAYGVSKAAVAMLTQTMATDLAGRGIRVNAVAPGFIVTDMTAGLDDGKVGAERFQRRTPLGRFGQADEVARSIAFLASDWAGYITGAVLPVDGGWCAFGGAGDASVP